MKKVRVNLTTSCGPHTIEIVREDMRREGLKGQACYEDHCIRIDDSLTGVDLGEVLIHEALHMASDAAGFSLEEHQVKSTAQFLTQILNPWLDVTPLEVKT